MANEKSAFENIKFTKLLDKLQDIAFESGNQAQALNALKELKSWYDEWQKRAVADDMAERDVVDLLAQALATIPRKKYLEVLKLCREQRAKLIHERGKTFDVQAIVLDEKSKIDFRDKPKEEKGTEALVNAREGTTF